MVELSDAVRAGIAAKLHAWILKPSGTEFGCAAEVTAGGVDADDT